MGVDELSFNGLRMDSKLMKGAEKGTKGTDNICRKGIHCDLPYICCLLGSQSDVSGQCIRVKHNPGKLLTTSLPPPAWQICKYFSQVLIQHLIQSLW